MLTAQQLMPTFSALALLPQPALQEADALPPPARRPDEAIFFAPADEEGEFEDDEDDIDDEEDDEDDYEDDETPEDVDDGVVIEDDDEDEDEDEDDDEDEEAGDLGEDDPDRLVLETVSTPPRLRHSPAFRRQ